MVEEKKAILVEPQSSVGQNYAFAQIVQRKRALTMKEESKGPSLKRRMTM